MTASGDNIINVSNHTPGKNYTRTNKPDWLSLDLGAGIYVWNNNKVLPAHFSEMVTKNTLSQTYLDWKRDRTLADIYQNTIDWPDTDFIIDIDDRVVWVDKGCVSISFIESKQEKSDLYVYYEVQHQGQKYLLSGSFKSLKNKSADKKIWCFGADDFVSDSSVSETDLTLELRTKLTAYGVIASALLSTQFKYCDSKVDLGKAHVMTTTVKNSGKKSPPILSWIDPSKVGEG